jgi:DNA-directed RNA polymerase
LDATTSGCQHLAGMTKDLNLAKYVNLLKSSKDLDPEDLYKEMGKKINDIIENKLNDKDTQIIDSKFLN